MVIAHGCGSVACQFCYGDDITETEIAFYTEQRQKRDVLGTQAPAPPKPPAPRPRPTPLPHAMRAEAPQSRN